ncbi:MAG: DUF4325 domain-containing protein [Patescibacteria group bacterium]
MDIKKLILEKLKKEKKVKVSDIVKETNFSRAYIHRFFKELQNEKKIVSIGKTKKAFYSLINEKNIKRPLAFRRALINQGILEDLILEDIRKETDIFRNLNKNVSNILEYAFTEILNNSIEHSESKKILIEINKTLNFIRFQITDWGIGIFNDIKRKFKLKNTFSAIEHLLKGKQTTKPKKHSGEGIFFTSKIADEFIIKSQSKKLIFDNKINDIFVRNSKKTKGTKVSFEISINSEKDLSNVFKEYSNENFSFDKTKIIVKLVKLDGDSYISRSQARRLLFGLDKFSRIVFDFREVDSIGQSFADEIFRVWQKKNKKIKLEFINFNENVMFFIKRAIRPM